MTYLPRNFHSLLNGPKIKSTSSILYLPKFYVNLKVKGKRKKKN